MLATPSKTKTAFLTSHPVLLGVVIGLFVAGMVAASAIWFPSVGDTFGSHLSLVVGILSTIVVFFVLIFDRWRWRQSRDFWLLASITFLGHVIFAIVYTLLVRPLTYPQWIVVMAIDVLVFVFVIDRRLARSERTHRRSE